EWLVELLESLVDNGAEELGDPTEVVVDRHRREPARGRDRSRLDGGRSLLGQQPDRGLNDALRHTIACRIPCHLFHCFLLAPRLTRRPGGRRPVWICA